MPKSKTNTRALNRTAKAILWGIGLYAISFSAFIVASAYAFSVGFTGIMVMQLAALMSPILVVGAFASFGILKILEKNKKLALLKLKITPALLQKLSPDLENQLPSILKYQWVHNRALFLSNFKILKKEKKLWASNKDYSLVNFLMPSSEKAVVVPLIMDIIRSQINHDISAYGKDKKEEIIAVMLLQYMRQAIRLNHTELICTLPEKWTKFDYSGLLLSMYRSEPVSIESVEILLNLKDAQGEPLIDPDYTPVKPKYFTFLKLVLDSTPPNFEMAALLRAHGAKDFGNLSKEKKTAFKQWEKGKKPKLLAKQARVKVQEPQENPEVILAKKPRKRNKKRLS